MTLDVRPLDRSSDTEVRAYWEVARDAVDDRPYNTHLAWQAASTYLRAAPSDRQELRIAAWEGGRMVGVGALLAPVLENTGTAFADVAVAPELRRRGIGTTLLSELEDGARGLGRAVLLGEAFAPSDAESPGSLFAGRHGFHVELEDGMKVLDLREGRTRWPVLAAEARAHHGDYRIVTVWAPIPDELVDGYCRLNTAFMGEAPTGDAAVELERWDLQRVRDREDRVARAGRRDVHTFALDASGEVVGLSELFINETMPNRSFQSGTLVMPDHRGHRLGLAVKVANLHALVERYPQVEWIVTGNASVNAPMNAINERLGFRVVERCLELRKELA